jgi:hypothetical protein
MEDTNKNTTTDIKQYRKNYYQTHKNNYFKKILCNVCNYEYISANKSHHMKSKRHLHAVQLNCELFSLRSQLAQFTNNNVLSN